MQYTVTVSSRLKDDTTPMASYLDTNYNRWTLPQIESVFGFTEHSPLYGGSIWHGEEISKTDLTWMYDNNIGYGLPLTNLIATYRDYKQNRDFIKKHHRPGNTIVTIHDWMAEALRTDFPNYTVEASAIKATKTMWQLEKLCSRYDVVVPSETTFNHDLNLLASIRDKSRIRLMLQYGCTVYCQNQICFGAFSRANRGEPATATCIPIIDYSTRLDKVVKFDIDQYLALGFTKFKEHYPDSIPKVMSKLAA